MVERGARYLVYLSPTAGTSDNHKAFFHELAVQGCHSTAVAGTVTSIEDVREAIARSVKPIAGVYQLAVALKVDGMSQRLRNHAHWVLGLFTLQHVVRHVERTDPAKGRRGMEPASRFDRYRT